MKEEAEGGRGKKGERRRASGPGENGATAEEKSTRGPRRRALVDVYDNRSNDYDEFAATARRGSSTGTAPRPLEYPTTTTTTHVDVAVGAILNKLGPTSRVGVVRTTGYLEGALAWSMPGAMYATFALFAVASANVAAEVEARRRSDGVAPFETREAASARRWKMVASLRGEEVLFQYLRDDGADPRRDGRESAPAGAESAPAGAESAPAAAPAEGRRRGVRPRARATPPPRPSRPRDHRLGRQDACAPPRGSPSRRRGQGTFDAFHLGSTHRIEPRVALPSSPRGRTRADDVGDEMAAARRWLRGGAGRSALLLRGFAGFLAASSFA